MSLVMPKPDEATLLKSSSIINGLKKISKHVLSEEEEKAVYETDGLSIHRQKPIAVVLPETTKEVSLILKYCYDIIPESFEANQKTYHPARNNG